MKKALLLAAAVAFVGLAIATGCNKNTGNPTYSPGPGPSTEGVPPPPKLPPPTNPAP
jgi:hypothetical protein